METYLGHRTGDSDVDELVQQTPENDPKYLTGGLSQSVDEVDLAVMRADTAADAHAALLNDADGNPHVLLENLTEMGVHADQYGSDTTAADALNDTATVDVE